MRCIVRVAVGTQPIRALFAGEKPPVADTEWDEAAYVAQRLRAYAEALENLALVRPMTSDGGNAASASGSGDEGESDACAPADGASFSCPRTGDRVRVEPDDRDDGARGDAYADIERALQRVFADAHAWRRHLLPAYFERHRNWRAVVGAPIQH
ncbi:MAG: hypothetical protein H3C59_02875 [Burkholderiaceae bacterium]|nr:hypothetical protein [Burkholderiaceae bacterium]MCD6675203.1 hypothetical protein [Burkholderiaceae bacterium]